MYHHLLLALDDDEMYDGQTPLTLSQSRAVASSLNSLVFHTYLPKQVCVGLCPYNYFSEIRIFVCMPYNPYKSV
jgi:hypothetical protein